MATSLTEDEQELVREMTESAGWKLLVLKVVAARTSQLAATVVTMARTGNAVHDAGVEAGRIDGMMEVVRSAYDAAHQKPPDYIKALKEFRT